MKPSQLSPRINPVRQDRLPARLSAASNPLFYLRFQSGQDAFRVPQYYPKYPFIRWYGSTPKMSRFLDSTLPENATRKPSDIRWLLSGSLPGCALLVGRAVLGAARPRAATAKAFRA